MLLLKCLAGALVVVIPWVAVSTGWAQQPRPTLVPLLDTPQVLNSVAGRIRVVPIKGLVYPWADAFRLNEPGQHLKE